MNWRIATFLTVTITCLTSLIVWNDYNKWDEVNKVEIEKAPEPQVIYKDKIVYKTKYKDKIVYRLDPKAILKHKAEITNLKKALAKAKTERNYFAKMYKKVTAELQKYKVVMSTLRTQNCAVIDWDKQEYYAFLDQDMRKLSCYFNAKTKTIRKNVVKFDSYVESRLN